MFNRALFPFSFNDTIQPVYKDMAITFSGTCSVYSEVRPAIVSPFNRTRFNNGHLMHHKTFDYNADMTMQIEMSGVGTVEDIEYEVNVIFLTDTMHGESTFNTQYMRERTFNESLSGISNVYANFNRYTIKKLEYTGDVLPGDMIIIDADRMTVTKNNENALKYFEGDFFELAPSYNELIYSDSEPNRNVVLVTRYKDRWL